MSNFFIALIVAVCGSIWLYFKFFAPRTGNYNSSAIVGTVVTAVIIFVVVWGTLSLIFS